MTPKFVFAVRLFMAVCFIILATCIWFFRDKTQLTLTQTYAFVTLLTLYGLFRIYRAVKKSDDIFVEK